MGGFDRSLLSFFHLFFSIKLNTETPVTYELVSKAEGHEFVNGNTKHLHQMNQKDLAVLFKNGDARVRVKKEAVAVSAPTTKKVVAKLATAEPKGAVEAGIKA